MQGLQGMYKTYPEIYKSFYLFLLLCESAPCFILCSSNMKHFCMIVPFFSRLSPSETESDWSSTNLTVMVGHNVSFHCEVLSGHPHVMWFQGYLTSFKNTKVCKPSQCMIACQLDNFFIQDPDPVTMNWLNYSIGMPLSWNPRSS
jgi:hypothetical protein